MVPCSHLDIWSCWVGEVHLLELNSTVKFFWNNALIGAGINGWLLYCVHVSSMLPWTCFLAQYDYNKIFFWQIAQDSLAYKNTRKADCGKCYVYCCEFNFVRQTVTKLSHYMYDMSCMHVVASNIWQTFVRPSIHPSIHPSIYPSIYLSIYSYLSIYLFSVHQSINLYNISTYSCVPHVRTLLN